MAVVLTILGVVVFFGFIALASSVRVLREYERGVIFRLGRLIALVFGGLLLFNTNNSAYEISVPIVIFTAAMLGSFFAWVISKAVQARHGQVHTGSEELIGAHGVVRSRLDPVGHVFVKGALWRAHTADDRPLEVGEEVVVEAIDGLTLTVAPTVREPEPQRVE